jgi:hypothetical protein
VAGSTTITGGASGTWQAVGDGTTIGITADNITGTGTGATLTGGANNSAAIAVAAAEELAATLTVTSATIDISTNGTVTLTGNNDGTPVSAIMVLKGATANPAALLFDAANTTEVATIGTTGLNINTSNPAAIKFKGDAIVNSTLADTTGFTATLLVESSGSGDVSGTGGKAAGKLVGGTAGGDDLSIVSSTDASTETTIVKTSKLKGNS